MKANITPVQRTDRKKKLYIATAIKADIIGDNCVNASNFRWMLYDDEDKVREQGNVVYIDPHYSNWSGDNQTVLSTCLTRAGVSLPYGKALGVENL